MPTALEKYCQKSTNEEVARDLKIAVEVNPMGLLEQGLLSIKTKKMELITLKLNDTQVSINKIIKDLQKQGKPVRLWILKARQEGVSTDIEAIVYAYTSQRENVNSLIMADEKDHANNLFEMSKLYHEMLEKNHPFLAPKLKKSNEKKLEFEGIHSQIIIATAENLEAAKSHTFQFVHLSECAYFRDLKTVMNDLNQTVPDLPGTMIIGETTANGMEDFHDKWEKAIEGSTEWIPVFIPWFALLEYSMSLENGEFYSIKGINFDTDMSEFTFVKEEQELKKEYELTDEQLNWRRYAIVNKCDGDLPVFNREYPACWRDAFQTSGKNFFNNHAMIKQIKHQPIKVGEIFEEGMDHNFRSMPEGRIKIYETPKKYEQYSVTIDASEAVGQDEGSIYVHNVRLNQTAAVVNGQYPPEDLSHMGVMLGNYYNKCMIIPENKGYGYMVCQQVSKKYGNIYRRKKTKDGEQNETEELGFNTNLITRPEMLGRLAAEILKNSTKLMDKHLIKQCQSFIIDPKTKKAQAAPNKQDGLVICRAIAAQVRHEHPYKPPEGEDASERTALNRAQSNVPVGTKFGK